MTAAHICIARHGETDWNKSGILQGWLDVPINPHGRRQAHELAATLTAAGFAAVWTSPLARARETADIVATALGLAPPTCHDGLKERHFGAVQGIPKNELAEYNPALYEQILRRNPAAQLVGGESMDEFADRVHGALMEIGARHRGGRVLVITHGWVMDVVTRHISGVPRDAVLHLKRQNGECVWVEATEKAVSAMRSSVEPAHSSRDHAVGRIAG
ncbi:histidine phosphatase family protein [Rhodoferax sp.]|uniref:histidine phosphatase family protein n=1 Tax=Rhodoferax sp. TaxID=50421 RepID=UPI00277603D7|nr:histidine phosphatase family protein [Rhodoferax sp.]